MTPRTRRRGYTIVELMMSLAVLTIGAGGVIAMQRVTLASNQHAKNLAVANGVAQAWADALAADASLWNSTTDLGDTAWLQSINANAGVWIRPDYSPGHQFGPAFSPLGEPLATADIALARYCTDIRLSWIQNQPGAGLIRAEIRVFWRRENAVTTSALPAALCTAANPSTNMSAGGTPEGYHFVLVTTALSRQTTGS